jgi:hypothetical protein
MEAVQGRPRLSRRGREALLLGATRVAARDAVGADHCADRRAVPSRQSHRGPRAFVIEPQTHYRARAYAVEPSKLCRLDTRTHQRRANEIGPKTSSLTEIILRERTHPEQGFRATSVSSGTRPASDVSGFKRPAPAPSRSAPAIATRVKSASDAHRSGHPETMRRRCFTDGADWPVGQHPLAGCVDETRR